MSASKTELSASRIMVVDDSPVVRLAIKQILMSAGFDVVCASDGHEAIDGLATNPDLMVLDINMPGLDGYGVCRRIRSCKCDA